MAYLVHLGVFSEVVMTMLIVGHTHIDIDQKFSVWSRALKFMNGCFAVCWVTFVHILTHSFRLEANRPRSIKLIDSVHDWSRFFHPYIDPRLARYSCSQKSGEAIHQFIVKRNQDEKIRMYYKQYASSPEIYPRPYHEGTNYEGTSCTAQLN